MTSMLKGKSIVVGITGSIAAYKSVTLVRLLVKEQADVRVIMTKDACNFISPLTLSTLSDKSVLTELVDEKQQMWSNHVAIGRWADFIVVAPASAHTMAKLAQGQCDNMLIAVCMSATCPMWLAPAMDNDMWNYPATQKNLMLLREYGYTCVEPEHGELASGITGMGRMAEPSDIVSLLKKSKNRFSGKKALVTAGPTYEFIDPVRFIGNKSSGKMGFAIAEALAKEGAVVTLVSGPTQCKVNHSNIEICHVVSAEQMWQRCQQVFVHADITVLAAAVADYCPKYVSNQKIKKTGASINITLNANRDIAKVLGKCKRKGQIIAGFALETENGQDNAKQKMRDKNMDFIVLNQLHEHGVGFDYDTNKITIIDQSQRITTFQLKSKNEVALDIVDFIAEKVCTIV